MERTGHRSEKDRAPEWNKREDRGKAQGERRNIKKTYDIGVKTKTLTIDETQTFFDLFQ